MPQHLMYWWRGDIYSELEDYDRALADLEFVYKLAVKNDEKDAMSITKNMAQIYYDMEQYDKSDAMYNRMFKVDETAVLPMFGLAVITLFIS